MATITYEQAVYGSFPFWSRGYDLLGRSPGCLDSWVSQFVLACQRYGQPPAGTVSVGGWFSMPLNDRTRLFVAPSSQGRDDRGRPMALAFHGLFFSPREFQRLRGQFLGSEPRARTEWSPTDTTLPAGQLDLQRYRRNDSPVLSRDPAPALASLLWAGRRVAIESPTPLDALLGRVWDLLPNRVRTRSSLASHAYSNDNQFELLVSPRLHGLLLDPETICLEGDRGEDGLFDQLDSFQKQRDRKGSRWFPLSLPIFSNRSR